MSRLRRLETTGKTFLVTCNVHRQAKPLAPPERDLLLAVIQECRTRLRFLLFAYVVLPNHWHALILPAAGQSISTVMHAIKRVSALRINQRRRTRGPLWQGRFFESFLRRVRDATDAVEYIHSNPVRHGFVRHPAAWRWSSYQSFLRQEETLLAIDPLQLPLDPNQFL